MGQSIESGNWFGNNSIYLNINQIGTFIAGTNGVDSRTMGFGMVFFHEYLHTKSAGNYPDPPEGTLGVGIPDMIGNTIRNELGNEWGQRIDYHPTQIDGVYYLPFTPDAYDCLKSNVVPESGYIRWTGRDAKYWVIPPSGQ